MCVYVYVCVYVSLHEAVHTTDISGSCTLEKSL